MIRVARALLLGAVAVGLVLSFSFYATSGQESNSAAQRADLLPESEVVDAPVAEPSQKVGSSPTRSKPVDPFRAKAQARKYAKAKAAAEAKAEARRQAKAQARAAKLAERKRAQAQALAAKQKQEAQKSAASSSGSSSSGSSKSASGKSDVDSGSSDWKGRALRNPNGSQFPDSVLRWANLVQKVMAEHKIPDRNLVGILAQIQRESGGQPDIVNNSDSNAAKGTPAKGLLQIIAPTYQANAKVGYSDLKYQTVPYANLWAALNYVKRSYGMSKFDSWNAGSNGSY